MAGPQICSIVGQFLSSSLAGTTTLSSTNIIHTQQPDRTWSTAVVPCEPRAVAVVDACASANADILARMQDELRQEVLAFSSGQATRDLGRVRIASKAMHEAMMGMNLSLMDLDPAPSVAQLTALGSGTAFRKLKQVPIEQRCTCTAARALEHMDEGEELCSTGWVPSPTMKAWQWAWGGLGE